MSLIIEGCGDARVGMLLGQQDDDEFFLWVARDDDSEDDERVAILDVEQTKLLIQQLQAFVKDRP